MQIAFFELEGWEGDRIRESFPHTHPYLTEEKLDERMPAEVPNAEIVSVFVNSRVNGAVLERLPYLKFLATRSTGYDHIDLSACSARGVKVAYVPGYGDNTVAEFTFGLILNLTRKIYAGIDQIKESGSFSLKGLRGIDLKGKTLGVIGTGRIGKEMVRIAKVFGMEVLAFDPRRDIEFARALGFEYVSLEDLLSNSDIITIHCLLCDETKHLINRENIRLIKPGAYLVNTARGGIVETEALVEALEKGILAGAALDVLEEEGETKDELGFLTTAHPREQELRTILENHVLMKMPNVLITPHTAFNSQEALERILSATIENIKGFMKGKPINLVPQP